MTAITASEAARKLDAPLSDVLRWAEEAGGSQSTIVDLDAVNKNRDAEIDEQRANAEAAINSDNKRTARAGRNRQSKTAKRVQLDFSLQPTDRTALREIQDWVNTQIARMAWIPETGWTPAAGHRKPGSEQGTISYKTPVGWVDNVPANDFRRMTTGVLAWKVPSPNPSYSEQRKQADRLASLEFQATTCRMCGKPLEKEDGPEMSQIRKLLEGRFVLPYIHESLGSGVEELRFRRLHLLHSVWEERLAGIQIELDLVSSAELAKRLEDAVPAVLAEAKRRKPDTTEDDVYAALDEVLEYWETDTEGTPDGS